jgi:plastocyanin
MTVGGIVDCTFTNTQRGRILVQKVTDPAGDPQEFEFSLTGGPGGVIPQSFKLSDNSTPFDSGDLKPSNGSPYILTETVPAGWDLTSATCDDGSSPGAINLDPGETVTCTFIDTKLGNIIIDKVTDPAGDPQEFDFSLTGGPDGISQTFKLADATTPHNSGMVKPGTYQAAETTVPDGWDLTSATCVDEVGTSSPGAINLDPGETVTCTFIDTKLGNIIIDKVTDPAGDPQEFDFSLTGGPDGINQTFQLADATTPHNSGTVKPGTYQAAETTVPEGWDLTSATCVDEVGTSIPSAINLAPGETVTCTFTNTAHGNIIIDKVTNPAGDPQLFDFSLTGGPDGINQTFQLADATTPYNSGEVKTGTYAAAETVLPGWDLTSATCDDGSSPEAINLSPGETVTCTFTNSTGAIKIVKTAKNANAGPGDHPHAGVDFEIRLGGVLVDTVTTGSDGTACLDGLIPGEEYTVTEIVPDGYEVDSNNPQTVTVTAGATCSSGTPNVVNFSNTPLSKLDFIFHSLAGAGVTNATIQCVDIHGTPVDLQDGVTFSLDNLLPDTYTCTIVIDP